MGITTIDIVIVGLILFLSLKGLMGGFIREFFSAFGVLAGVYIASHFAKSLAILIHNTLLKSLSLATLNLIAFIVILSVVWWLISMLGKFVTPMEGEELSLIDRVGGYIVTVIKYFMIFSLIIYVLMHSPVIKRKSIFKKIESSSVYPYMNRVGGWLLNNPKDGK